MDLEGLQESENGRPEDGDKINYHRTIDFITKRILYLPIIFNQTKHILQMETLFGRQPIISISYSNDEIIKSIMSLYDIERFDLDCTYSKGVFWKNLPQPTMKSDLNPINDEVIKADVKALPFESESFSSVMFDPPFVMDTTNHNSEKKGSGIIAKRFSSFDSWAQLKEVYSGGLSEIYRCLKVGGILVFKCQDTVMGRRNYFTHCFVMNAAIEVGFCPKDLFVLMTKNTITGAWENQIHARKHHSFFWVFKKSKNGIHYS